MRATNMSTHYCPRCGMALYSRSGLVRHFGSKVCELLRSKMTENEIADLRFIATAATGESR